MPKPGWQRETGRNSKSAKPLLDAVAAQLILQTWFETPHESLNNAGVVALPDAEAQCRQLADLIRPHLSRNPALVGIHSGGVRIAGRLR